MLNMLVIFLLSKIVKGTIILPRARLATFFNIKTSVFFKAIKQLS